MSKYLPKAMNKNSQLDSCIRKWLVLVLCYICDTMRKFNYILLFVMLSLFFQLKSQENEIDSLWKVYKNTSQIDTNRLKAINTIARSFGSNNPDTAFILAKEELQLAQQTNQKKYEANALNLIGIYYMIKGNYPEALKNHFASLNIRKETKDKFGIAGSYSNIGLVYWKQGDYTKTLEFYSTSLKIYEEIGDKKGVANLYNNIGIINWNQGNYPEALKNYFAALKIREELKDKTSIAASYLNIGIIYLEQGDYPEALKNFFSALKTQEEIKDKDGIANSYNNIALIYYKQGNLREALKHNSASLKIRQEIKDIKGVALSYNNIALIHYDEGNYQEALKLQLAALKIYEEIGDKDGIGLSYINLGRLYIKLNKTKEAQISLEKGLQLSKEIGGKDRIKESYGNLAVLDSALGNYKAAYEHHKLFIIYRDSLNNEETKKKNLQASMQYEFDKKEMAAKAEQDKLDAITAKEKQKQQIIVYTVAGLLLLVAVFAAFMYNRFRVTQKQKVIIEIKERETTAQKHIIEEKHKEITDSINYAERIQHSFLATKEILDANLKNYFVFFKPKDVVSGDFYWAATLNNGNFVYATADSTGHGVPGAIMSILNISSLEKAIEKENEPAEILNATRKLIIERLKKDGSIDGGKDGMDCSLCVIDKNKKTLYVSAANNAVWIIRKNEKEVAEFIEIKPDKMAVGKHDKQDVSFTQQNIDLHTGDIIYTLTDGFPDQFGGPKGKKFMYKSLKELLASIVHLPMDEQRDKLEMSFNNWKGSLEQVDDVCIIGVRI